MPLCIGVDCDEVLAETIDELLNKPPLSEKGIKKSDINSYYLRNVKKIGITQEEGIKLFFGFFDSPEFYNTKPVKGSIKKLKELKQQGHKLYVVTARAEQFKKQTIQRIEQYFPNIFSEYLFMNQFKNNEVSKSQLCKNLGIQLLIDDNITNILDVNIAGIPGILLDKPWNQGQEDTKLLKRVRSRDEINI